MKILIIEPCGLHAAYLGCYGNDWVATPNLDSLAAAGIVFDQHIVDCPESSLDAPLLQRSAGTGRYRWPPLTTAGAETGADVVLPGGIRCRRVLCAALDEFGAVGKAVRAWLKSDCPVLWLEGPNLAPPWDVSEDILSLYSDDAEEEDDLLLLQNTYAALVTYWDALLGNLLDTLRAKGILDEITIWVTARAGLSLEEHESDDPLSPRLHDELVHVPLVGRGPGLADAGQRVLALTQPVDLLPTLGDLLGIPIADIQGSSLRPLALGQVEHIRPYAVAALRSGDEEAWLLRSPEWAFHLPIAGPVSSAPRLYVKPDDRWEVNDVCAHQADLADRLEATLRAFAEAVRAPGPLTYPALASERP
jgi:hypothetical protein